MKTRISALTDIGNERECNEDLFGFCPDLALQNWDAGQQTIYQTLGKYGTLAIVADGMGGQNAGEVAADIAIHAIMKSFTADALKYSYSNEELIHKQLKEAVRKADEAILKHSMEHPDTSGMGTTIVILWLLEGCAHIAWCGDSRCYTFTAKEGLRPLTKDHSYVQQLLDEGKISYEETFTHEDNNMVTRCLGEMGDGADPDIISYKFQGERTFLLCSDGLCGYIRDKEIERLLYCYYDDIGTCSKQLLDKALNDGSKDNITILALSVIPDDEESPTVTFFTKVKRKFKQKSR